MEGRGCSIGAVRKREVDKDNAVQENGVWAGLSPSKKDRKLIPGGSTTHANAPMRSLRSLDLSHNKLSNAALGIPDLASRRGKPTDGAANGANRRSPADGSQDTQPRIQQHPWSGIGQASSAAVSS